MQGPAIPPEDFAARRQRVADRLGDDVLVVATHAPKVFSNDVEYPFRPQSDFWYLTGFNEPDAVLVLDGSGHSTLFTRPRKPEAEIWTGRRLGAERAPDVLGVDAAHPLDELSERLGGLLGDRRVHAIADHAPDLLERLSKTDAPEDGGPLVAAERIRKDANELAMMQHACDLGVDAMRRARQALHDGVHEYEVEAELLHAYRQAGSTGPGYPPIVGSGANAAVLHYTANRDRIRDGQLVLIDAGCEWGHYTSDITRTYGVGEVPALARELYALVDRAHDAALAKAVPGNSFRDPHDAAVSVLTAGLIDMELLDGPYEQAIEQGTYRRFFMHGTSHLLGLDVHDVGRVKGEDGKVLRLEEGMVLTVEPGLYFNPDFATCPPGTEGIGIRIEDDVAIGADGPRVLTAALERTLEPLEVAS